MQKHEDLKQGVLQELHIKDLNFYAENFKELRIPILILDSERKVVFTTRIFGKLLRYTDAELHRMKFDELFVESDVSVFETLVAKGRFEGNLKVHHDEGAKIPVYIRMYDLKSSNSGVYYQLIIDQFYPEVVEEARAITYMLKKATSSTREAVERIRKINMELVSGETEQSE